MTDINDAKESLSKTLEQIVSLLEKHQLVESLVHKQQMPKQIGRAHV